MIGRPCTAKGVLEYQESNTFLRAENAMNVQARESVCHGKKLYRPPESYNINVLSFLIRNFRHPNHRIGAHTRANHTVPTGRLFSGGAIPGTSCQATIGVVPTGRACGHFATGFS